MEVMRDGAGAPPALRGGAVAIGNFDGVHLGHQAVIGAAVRWARARGAPAIVATFEPHPSRHFRPEAPPFQLTSLAQKLRHFAGLGVDGAMVIPFDAALAGLSAEAFVDRWLVGRLAPRHLVTGADFGFGHRRSGNAATLAALGASRGFSTEALAPVEAEGAPVSSTRVREALARGDAGLATRLLTRPFAIEGPVIHGDKRGRTIGVPTANMEAGAYARPRYGVYAVRVRLPAGESRPGVANFGIRPMFEPPRELLETWILDWEGDLYGQSLEVGLVAFLREERRLDGLEALKRQILADAEAARAALG
ncbi:bifunctional riboflavin kinase/FAD synthetase [Thermaurantiacus tibetensis]|uniref:bifunctional riboflavin kinase/FAD synthetase n=1 Tax=Thermaurantiacus tibetensis TaxID=2759035 RepID=UPI00188EFC82|nr:bifunctional riboflavin kinase/FAD synthetase [Thermaurantiacus tibetensis]